MSYSSTFVAEYSGCVVSHALHKNYRSKEGICQFAKTVLVKNADKIKISKRVVRLL